MFFMIVVALISFIITKRKVLEINRKDKTIATLSRYCFSDKKQILPITDFDSIKMSLKAKTVEEGDLTVVYSLVLSGSNSSIEILSVDDRTEAEKHLDELSTFLNFKAK